MRTLSLRIERLADLDPADLVRVAAGAATRDGKCQSMLRQCPTDLLDCLPTYDACFTAQGCG